MNIIDILGRMPRYGEFEYQVSMTYEHWTQADLDAGETTDRGHVYCDEWMSRDELLHELQDFTEHGLSQDPMPCDNRALYAWISNSYEDPFKGIVSVRSLHLHAIKRPTWHQPEDHVRHGLRYDIKCATNADFFCLLIDAGILTPPFKTVVIEPLQSRVDA